MNRLEGLFQIVKLEREIERYPTMDSFLAGPQKYRNAESRASARTNILIGTSFGDKNDLKRALERPHGKDRFGYWIQGEEVMKLAICRIMAAHRQAMDIGLAKLLRTRTESSSRVLASCKMTLLYNINLPRTKASTGTRTARCNLA